MSFSFWTGLFAVMSFIAFQFQCGPFPAVQFSPTMSMTMCCSRVHFQLLDFHVSFHLDHEVYVTDIFLAVQLSVMCFTWHSFLTCWTFRLTLFPVEALAKFERPNPTHRSGGYDVELPTPFTLQLKGGQLRFQDNANNFSCTTVCWHFDSRQLTGTTGSRPQGLHHVKHWRHHLQSWSGVKQHHLVRKNCTSVIHCIPLIFSQFRCQHVAFTLDFILNVWTFDCASDFNFGWRNFSAFIFATLRWRSGTISWDPHYSTNVA